MRRVTPYRQLSCRAIAPDGYPDTPLAIDLASPTLPAGLIKRLERQSTDEVGLCLTQQPAPTVTEPSAGTGQARLTAAAAARGVAAGAG